MTDSLPYEPDSAHVPCHVQITYLDETAIGILRSLWYVMIDRVSFI